MMQKALHLTPAQSARIQPVLHAQVDEIDKARAKYKAAGKTETARKEAAESLQATHTKYDAQIKNELTPDQLTKWPSLSINWSHDLKP